MVNTIELRIGNLVNYGSNKVIKEGIRGTSHIISDSDFKFAEFYDPIPLTEEILQKFGFTPHENPSLFFFKEFRYSISSKSITLLRHCDKAGESQEECCGFPFLTDNIKCEFVHQFQNLYFALTGNELLTPQSDSSKQ